MITLLGYDTNMHLSALRYDYKKVSQEIHKK